MHTNLTTFSSHRYNPLNVVPNVLIYFSNGSEMKMYATNRADVYNFKFDESKIEMCKLVNKNFSMCRKF